MIEIVYKENTKDGSSEQKIDLPKNVRQIGEPEETRKIYIEDYVMTFLRQYAKEELLNVRGAILLGHSKRMNGIPYLFIKSAVALKGIEGSRAGIPFTDQVWADIYEQMKLYFADQDILGWFLSMPGLPLEPDSSLLKTHINYFGGVDKVLMTGDPTEGEEEFFAYENGRLARQRGYYIFYERNEPMQHYMVENGDGESIDEKEEYDDRAIRSFRTLVQEKKDMSGQKRIMTFLYTASTFLVMVVLVIGITLINNYEKMEDLEMTLSEISQSLTGADENGQFLDNVEKANGEQLAAAVQQENIESQPQSEDQLAQQPVEEGQVQPAQGAAAPEEGQTQPVQEQPLEGAQTQPVQEQLQQPAEESQDAAPAPQYYIVQKGDTLLNISRKVYGNDSQIDAIANLNGIGDNDKILIGQKLLLP